MPRTGELEQQASEMTRDGQEGTVARMSGGGAETKSEGKEKSTKKEVYRPEDWTERHPYGLPQRLLDMHPELVKKLDNIFPKSFDSSKMQRWVPSRPKQCTATPEEQAKYIAAIDEIFSEKHRTGQRVAFPSKLIVDVLTKMRDILKKEPMLMDDIPNDTYVVGNLHGNIYDLYRIFHHVTEQFAPGKKIYEYGRYVFLGSYVDRGYNSLDVVMVLFMLKILYPDRFILLRGNHEFFQTNTSRGFFEELVQRYDREYGGKLHNAFNNIFGYLSVAAVIGGRICCMHGGVSSERFTKGELLAITKPIHDSINNVTVHDIVWSEPMVGLEGSMFNKARGTSIFFGEDLMHAALKKIGCLFMIRGHTLINAGVEFTWEGRCLTVFSATGSGQHNNDGSYAYISASNVLKVTRIPLLPKHSAFLRDLIEKTSWNRFKKQKPGEEKGVTGAISVYGKI